MKTNKLMVAVVAILAAGAQNIAHADSIALAQLDLNNFKWTNKATSAALSNAPSASAANKVTIVAGNNSGNLSVGLGAASSPGHHDSVSIATGGQIPLHQECLGACGGSIPTLPPSVTATFAYASHSLTGALVDLDTNHSGGPEVFAGASAHASAESSARLMDGHTTLNNGTADLGTNTKFSFTPSTNLETLLSFDYIARAMAAIVAPNGADDTSTASIQWNLSLVDNTTGANTLYDATTHATLGTSWVPGALNHTSIQVGGGSDLYNTAGSLSVQADLIAGHQYTIGIGHAVQSNVTSVPEPAVPALIGAGLLAFGLKRKRTTSDISDMRLIA